MTQPHILIAGAGYLGQALAARIRAEGQYRVFMLRRSAVPMAGAELIQADLLKPETFGELPPIDDIVYCAAADGHSEDSYRQIYQQGLNNLVKATKASGGYRRLIYISSTSVYAEHQGGWVDENNPDLVHQGPSRFMVSGERDLIEGPDDYTILRMGGIYGPGRTYFLRRVKEGAERIYSKGGLYSNRIHRDDCVGMILHTLKSAATRQIYNGVDSESADRNEVIRWMAQQLGQNPEAILRTDDLTMISHRGNKRIRNSKILSAGYKFIYPSYRQGYTALLHELKS